MPAKAAWIHGYCSQAGKPSLDWLGFQQSEGWDDLSAQEYGQLVRRPAPCSAHCSFLRAWHGTSSQTSSADPLTSKIQTRVYQPLKSSLFWVGTPFWNDRLENSFWTHTLPSAAWKDRPVHDGAVLWTSPSLITLCELGSRLCSVGLFPLCIKCETRGITVSVLPSSTKKWRKMNQKGESSVGSHGRLRRQTCCVGFTWAKVQSFPELLKGTCDSKEREPKAGPGHLCTQRTAVCPVRAWRWALSQRTLQIPGFLRTPPCETTALL